MARSLRAQIQEVSQRALASGHLLPIETQSHWVPDQAMTFLIRIVARLAEKPKPPFATATGTSPGATPRNPFLPYEPELMVAKLSSTHVALLNKFMVVPDHLLIVTRQFASQTEALLTADFLALSMCLRAYESVGFYNGGPVAGASQPHRHLQLIPLPLDTEGPPLPVEELLWQGDPLPEVVFQSPRLPFMHRAVRWHEPLPLDNHSSFTGAAQDDDIMWSQRIKSAYDRLLDSLGWATVDADHPYNLLVTRRGMLLVPRREECFAGVSLNAMAYAGALLVKDTEQYRQLLAAGPMQALCTTAGLL
jgi:ATP adenylyltransferase